MSDDRTTATGLFNTARSYWRSAEELGALKVQVSHTDVAIEARYIVTGFKERPANEALAQVASHLDASVCAALAKEGYAVRPETFTAPSPKTSNDLDEDATRLLVQLFKADEIDHRGVPWRFSSVSMLA